MDAQLSSKNSTSLIAFIFFFKAGDQTQGLINARFLSLKLSPLSLMTIYNEREQAEKVKI